MDLKKILRQRPEILSDSIKIKSLLGDEYNGDTAKVNRMMKAYDRGIVERLLQGSDNSLTRGLLVSQLVTEEDMIKEKAEWAVDAWFAILDNAVLTSYRKYCAEQDRKKQEKQVSEEIKDTSADLQVEQYSEPVDDGYNPDDFGCFINPVHLASKGTLIPCGVGNTDNGFVIHGISPTKPSKHPYGPILAVIYNFLIRNTKLTDDDIPQAIREIQGTYVTDFRMVFRYEVIIISAIRCGLAPNGLLNLRPLDYVGEFRLAIKSINIYLGVFCRLAGVSAFEIRQATHAKYTVSLESKKASVYVTDNEKYTVARELCFSQKINYHLSKKNLNDLEYLLREISPFDSFKEGQFDALCNMMNSTSHSVCIMPTGSGKSLIYYFASILQPLPVFVISPTDILIKDQIRNLRKFHHMDNVAHLKIATGFDFEHMELCNSLIYLTPATFQNRYLFVRFRHLNKEQMVSYVVLDEIHCLSNWGHDFRPEYLMLSKNLNKLLDRTTFLGFTATANYTVVEDIQKQLNIPQQNFFSPIAFEKYNATYHYRKFVSIAEMYKAVAEISESIVRRNEKAIVFTKNDDISDEVQKAIGYQADMFTTSSPEAYFNFVDGNCNILVTSEDLGVGINFSDVTNIIHFGLPVSKNEYVQEVGRAGRGDEHIQSYILFLEPSVQNVDPILLQRDAPINHMAQVLSGMNNDYADCYHKLNMNADTSDILMDRLKDIFGDLRGSGRGLFVLPYDEDTIDEVKKYLYMLFVCGYIQDWYSYKALDAKKQIEIMIDVSATNHEFYEKEENMLARMKKKSTDYFVFMGNDRESIAKIARAGSALEIIKIYVDWYYEKYLYHHKEEFLDMFDFVMANLNGDLDKITEEIKDYFVLPFVQLKTDESYYLGLSVKDIANKVLTGIGKETLANIERINSNHYSYKLDLLLCLGYWRMAGRFDQSRLERLWKQLGAEEKGVIKNAMLAIYPECKDRAKWEFLTYIDGKNCIEGLTLDDVLKRVYSKGYRDMIFYGLVAKRLNQRFKTA